MSESRSDLSKAPRTGGLFCSRPIHSASCSRNHPAAGGGFSMNRATDSDSAGRMPRLRPVARFIEPHPLFPPASGGGTKGGEVVEVSGLPVPAPSSPPLAGFSTYPSPLRGERNAFLLPVASTLGNPEAELLSSGGERRGNSRARQLVIPSPPWGDGITPPSLDGRE
jgi:hypothetical protein